VGVSAGGTTFVWPSPRVMLAVAGGGVLGGAARLLAGLLGDVSGVPAWAVLLVVNLLGSFLIGLVAARGGRWSSAVVTTGVLGGFTSFSGWVLDVLRLVEPAPVLALALLVAVPVAAVSACLAGLLAGGERP
jgi:CrcB protein